MADIDNLLSFGGASPAPPPQAASVTPQAPPPAAAGPLGATPGEPSAPPQAAPRFIDSIPSAGPQGGSPFATIDPAVLAERQPKVPSSAPMGAEVADANSADPANSALDWLDDGSALAHADKFVYDVARSDFIVPAVFRAATDLGFTPDPTYQTPAYGSDAYKQLVSGIDPQYQGKLASAVSADHAQWLRNEILTEQAAEQRLASYGGWGVAGRVASNLLDPVALAVGA